MTLPSVDLDKWSRPGFKANLTRAIARDTGRSEAQVSVDLAAPPPAPAGGRRSALATTTAGLGVVVTLTGFGDDAVAANAAADAAQSALAAGTSQTAQVAGAAPVRASLVAARESSLSRAAAFLSSCSSASRVSRR